MKEIISKEIISTGHFTITVGNILLAGIIFIAAYLIVYFLSFLITRAFKRKEKPDGRHFSIIQLVKYFIWVLAIVFILQSLGLNVTFLIASSAALLVGIGLGLQNLFKDFISGIALLIEGTIKVDDVVEVDGLVVKVIEISIRTSKVTTRDDNVVIIPNHMFVEEKIVNWTNNMLPTRFIIEVGVEYSVDTEVAQKALIESALSHKDVIKEQAYYPSVRLNKFGNSSLEFQLIFFSYNLFRIESVKSKIRLQILETFRKNNITIPFPQHVLHYRNTDSDN